MRPHRLLQGYKISFTITVGDCSRDEDAGSETKEMAKSEVAGVKEFDSSSSDFSDDELLDPPAEAARPNQSAHCTVMGTINLFVLKR